MLNNGPTQAGERPTQAQEIDSMLSTYPQFHFTFIETAFSHMNLFISSQPKT